MKLTRIISTSILGSLLFSVLPAHAEVVVVVGSKSTVSTLTKAQVTDIYLGRTKDFPNGGIALTTMISAGPAKEEFLEKVLGKTDSQARSVWARLTFTGIGTGPKELSDANELKKSALNNCLTQQPVQPDRSNHRSSAPSKPGRWPVNGQQKASTGSAEGGCCARRHTARHAAHHPTRP